MEPRKQDVTWIADMPSLLETSCDDYDADSANDNLSDLGGAKGKPPVSLKQTEFSSKQFAKRMGQANYCVFNKWKKVWVAGFLKKRYWSIIWGQNCWTQLTDGPLHWETAVADLLERFESWLLVGNFDNAE